MTTTNGNGSASKIEAVTESVTMRLIARGAMLLTPLLLLWGVNKVDSALDKLTDLDRRMLVIETRTKVLNEIRDDRDDDRRRRSSMEIPSRSMLPQE